MYPRTIDRNTIVRGLARGVGMPGLTHVSCFCRTCSIWQRILNFTNNSSSGHHKEMPMRLAMHRNLYGVTSFSQTNMTAKNAAPGRHNPAVIFGLNPAVQQPATLTMINESNNRVPTPRPTSGTSADNKIWPSGHVMVKSYASIILTFAKMVQ